MKKILKWILLLIIIITISWFAIEIYRENNIKQGNNKLEIQRTIQTEDEENNINVKRNLNLVPKKYKEYAVAANLKIKKINIDTNVLDKYSKKAMDVCVTKFYGPDANEVGNFCITGHNYVTNNMFGYLYKLELGDTIILSDNQYGVVEYKIYDKYRAKENETYRTISKYKWKKRSNFNYLLQIL